MRREGGGVDKKKQVVEQNGQRDVKDGIFKKQKDVVDWNGESISFNIISKWI